MSMPKMVNMIARNSGTRAMRMTSIFSISNYQSRLLSLGRNSVNQSTISTSKLITNQERGFSDAPQSSGQGHTAIKIHHYSNRFLAFGIPVWILLPTSFPHSIVEFCVIPIMGVHMYSGVKDVIQDYVPTPFQLGSKLTWLIVSAIGTFGLWMTTVTAGFNNRDALLLLWTKEA